MSSVGKSDSKKSSSSSNSVGQTWSGKSVFESGSTSSNIVSRQLQANTGVDVQMGPPSPNSLPPGNSAQVLSAGNGIEITLTKPGEKTPPPTGAVPGNTDVSLQSTSVGNDTVTSGVDTSVAVGTPDPAITSLESAQAQYDAAKAQVDQLNQTLSQELGQIGENLTPEQQQAYIKAFHEKHAAEYEALEKSSQALEKALSNPALTDAMKCDPKAAQMAYKGLQSLADSPLADKALDIAQAWHNDPGTWGAPSSANGATAAEFNKNFSDTVLGPALSCKAAAQLADGMSVKEVAEHALAVTSAFGAAGDLPDAVSDVLKTLADGKLPDPAQFDQLAKSFGAMDAFGMAVGGLSAALSLKLAYDAGVEQDYLGAMSYLANGAAEGLDVIAGVMDFLSKGSGLAGKTAGFLEKMVPVLGCAASALATYQDWQALQDPNNPKVGLTMSLIGDGLATVGAYLELTPVAPVGAAANVVGTLVSVAGYGVTQLENQGRLTAEERELLEKVFQDQGLSESQAKDLTEGLLRGVLPRNSNDPAKNQEEYLSTPHAVPAPEPRRD